MYVVQKRRNLRLYIAMSLVRPSSSLSVVVAITQVGEKEMPSRLAFS